MALFGSGKDIDFFRGINQELINDIFQTEVDIYKLSLYDTKENIYGESLKKIYKTPKRIACLISTNDQDSDSTEFGINIKQTARFAFLRDDLITYDISIEVGDFVEWNAGQWEIDHVIENKLFMKRNPETNKTIGETFGWNQTINVLTHYANKQIMNLEEYRPGFNK